MFELFLKLMQYDSCVSGNMTEFYPVKHVIEMKMPQIFVKFLFW